MKKIIIFLALFIGLTGCVRYDVGITFPQANSGTIIQHIQLSEQLNNFNSGEGKIWLDNILNRAINLQGKGKYFSPTELVVTIPFYNGDDLVNKFNQMFKNEVVETNINNDKTDSNLTEDNLFDLSVKMSIKQNNLLFVERNQLEINADLTPLGVISSEGNLIISSGELVKINIQFDFPFGATLTANDFAKWEKQSDTLYNVELKAGHLNQINAIFWHPNYIGIGTLFIILFIIIGYLLKYQKLPLLPH